MNANTSLKQAIRQIYIAGIFSWKIEPVPGYGPVIRSSWSGGCFRVQRVPQDHRPEIIVPQEFHPAAILIAANPFERGKEARKRAAELACRENIHEEIRYTITERGEDYRFPAPLYRVSFFFHHSIAIDTLFALSIVRLFNVFLENTDPSVYGIYIFRNYNLGELLVNSLF